MIRFTAAAAVIGIAAGVAGLIIAQAVGRGFQAEISKSILSTSPHITILNHDNKPISYHALLIEKLNSIPGIVSVNANANAYAVINSVNGQIPIVLITDGTADQDRSIARPGIELAAKAGILAGDRVEIIVLAEDGSPHQRKITIGEPFTSGLYEQDLTTMKVSPILFGILSGQEVFTPTQIAVRVDDIHAADITANAIREVVGSEYRVIGWQQANAPLFEALSLERKAATAVILLIVIISILNIVTTLSLMVAERRADIAILRACGARSRTITIMFLLEGFLLGILGTAIGIGVGFVTCFLVNHLGIFKLDREIYAVGNIVLTPAFTDIFYIVTAALLLSLAAAIYPAFRSANVKPLENLRNVS